MLLWPGMMNAFKLSLKSESDEVLIVPTNTGDALASLLKMKSAQIYASGYQRQAVDPEEAVLRGETVC